MDPRVVGFSKPSPGLRKEASRRRARRAGHAVDPHILLRPQFKIRPMAILVYSRPRYDPFSHSRPVYASNLPWNWDVSHLKTLRIHERRGQFMLPIAAKLCTKSQPCCHFKQIMAQSATVMV
jgi:hypothetical protein